jgi:transcriptional regulator with XRE-family HTH domain
MESFQKRKTRLKKVMFKNIGCYLREQREKVGLTQIEVARNLGKYASSQFISNIERGIAFPPLKVLRGMISYYDIPEQEFLDILIKEKRDYLRQTLFDEPVAQPKAKAKTKKAKAMLL